MVALGGILSKSPARGIVEIGIAGLLAILPLVGLLWLVTYSPLTTVDGLFTALVLLTISGVFGIDVLMELREMGFLKLPGGKGKTKPGAPGVPVKAAVAAGTPSARTPGASVAPAGVLAGELVESDRGLVREIQFFEANVGQANKSLVTLLPDGSDAPRNLMFVGNVQNLIPLGKRVELTSRSKDDVRTLLECRHLY